MRRWKICSTILKTRDALINRGELRGNTISGLYVIYVCLVLGFVLFAPLVFAEDDPIHEKCMNQTDDPPPWCYQMAVEKIGDPKLCENILKYWPGAGGVHGVCYYNLARKQKDCALCNFIKNADIKKMCKLDVCNLN